MKPSVESRAIAYAANLPELVVTTSHLPQGCEVELNRLMADSFDVPPSAVVSFEDLEVLNRVSSNTNRNNPWFVEPSELVERAMLLQMASHYLSPLNRADTRLDSDSANLVHLVESWQKEVRGLVDWDDLKVDVASNAYWSLNGMFAPEPKFATAAKHLANMEQYAIPLSYSPELGSLTLKELLGGGIRSACLVPLATGVWTASAKIAAGAFVIGFQAALVGGGVTLVAISSLWIADKIMKGIRNVSAFDFREARERTIRPVASGEERTKEDAKKASKKGAGRATPCPWF